MDAGIQNHFSLSIMGIGGTGLKMKNKGSLHASIRGSFWHGVRGMNYLFIWTTININQVSHI